ncbi:response regulator transcription factor [Niallia taxi]|uniref:response regulator transcription factor n=1 Tax=Niallia taxi TaxID=2499688 RepID=UPI00119D0650|nr:response regulator transcription factor [Niallia taxi]MCT2346631.1 response regulator transcription factor [Niallia taxi]MDE5053994.1 response regulator transcription factor [Niallia taxi]MED3963996.1 response regulator transcription factor [Niallia taxi]WOD63611.1 response regulator transcription factor [Niallia taxi]
MITVIISEDQRMLRGALGTLLSFEDDIDVIGQAANGKEALELINTHSPDVCLLDIEMPVMSGLEVAEALQRKGAASKIIILTTFARPGYFERALKANVHGYLLKDGPSEELAEAIRNVMKGKREFASELIFGSMLKENPLTEREREILALVAKGKTVKEISSTLYLSSGTVRNYISEALNKLEVKNRIEAISKAQKNGWI